MTKSDTIQELLNHMKSRAEVLHEEYLKLGGVMKSPIEKSDQIKEILDEKIELHGAISVIYGILEK